MEDITVSLQCKVSGLQEDALFFEARGVNGRYKDLIGALAVYLTMGYRIGSMTDGRTATYIVLLR